MVVYGRLSLLNYSQQSPLAQPDSPPHTNHSAMAIIGHHLKTLATYHAVAKSLRPKLTFITITVTKFSTSTLQVKFKKNIRLLLFLT